MPNKPDQEGVSDASDRRAKVAALIDDYGLENWSYKDEFIDKLNEIERDWFLELIGEDETPHYGSDKWEYQEPEVRNELRAQLRAAVSKEMGNKEERK